MKHAIVTDTGVVRTENQDRAAFFTRDNDSLAILCDGMGGHQGGSIASSITVAVFKESFMKANLTRDMISKWFSETLALSVKQMKKYAIDRPDSTNKLMDMGTTVTAAYIANGEIIIFNVGDSRTYIYNGSLNQISEDQNLMNYYIHNYKYTPEEASKLMGAAALTSALGPTKTTKVDAWILPIDKNMQYVILTSDGIHDYIEKPIFEQMLTQKDVSLDEKGSNIIVKAVQGKSTDNLTIVIVDLKE